MLKGILLSAAMLAPATGFAAPACMPLGANDTVTAHHVAPMRQALPTWVAPPGKTAIFDTMDKGDHYNCCKGWVVSEPGSGAGVQQWVAFAITPTANATITEIVEAVNYAGGIAGANTVTVALLADNGGVPGAVLQEKTVKNIEGGGCCAVAVDHLTTGIPVTAGTTYWVGALLPFKGEANTFDIWNYTFGNTNKGTLACFDGTAWTVTSGHYAGFAVYGN